MKRISHDELRTRLTSPTRSTVAAVEVALSCYEDCECDALKARIAELELDARNDDEAITNLSKNLDEAVAYARELEERLEGGDR